MLAQFVLGVLTGWVGFLGLALLIGSLVVDLIVLPSDAPELIAVRRRLQSWRVLSVAALILAAAGELVLRAQTMTGGDVLSATVALPVVLTRTHFGTIWMARVVGLGLAALLAFRAGRSARGLTLLVAVGIALTVSLTGHAGDWGDLSLSAGVDWVHVLGASAWTGGLVSLTLVVLVEARSRPPALLGVVARRFSRLAAWCLAAVVLSGTYNAWVQLASVSALWMTPYGRIFGLKVLMVVGLVWWGCVNRYAVVPHLDRARGSSIGTRLFRLGRLVLHGPSTSPRIAPAARLCAYVGREALLAVVVFGVTAVLVHLTPGRHAGAGRHHSAAESDSVYVTMSQLHASGGVPEGWRFTPPVGDPARGREVFRHLGCFACHTVSGESFPPATGPGPDLSDVGEHHPASYLLESIINPNAVIVEGPGYMTSDRRSVMPAVSQTVSVDDVVDLVAFLSSLRSGASQSFAAPGDR